MADLNHVRSMASLVIWVTLLCMKPQIAAAEWFPFDMAVEDFWVTDEKGFRTSGNVTVPEGTALEIHCLWAVRPTKYVEVNEEIWWNGNVVLADDHTQGLFPIKIPPGKYGKKTWTSGGVLGVFSTQHSVSGAMKLDGEFTTGWNAVGAGDHKLGCVLDSFETNIDLEKTRANNRREITVTVTALSSPESGNVSSADAVVGNAQQVGVTITTSNPSAASPRQQQPDASPEPATSMGPAARALRTQNNDTQAPPNPCRKSVNFYVPEAPVLVTNGTALQVNDQFQIQCTFKKVTREIAWPQCDDAAKAAMRVLEGAEESGGRNSGIVSIDGSTVGVSSSPDGGGVFQSVKLWKFDSPGQHEISCQTDNAFRFAIEGEDTYLKAAISVDVGTRSDGRAYRGFEPDTAATLPVRPMPSEAMPRLRGLSAEPGQPGVTSLRRMRNGSHSPGIEDIEQAISVQQLSELQAIADAISRDDSLTPETENQWRSLLTEYRQQPGKLNVNELVQLVLRESYVNRNEGLQNFADKTRFFNDKKKEIRGEIEGSTPQQVATALLDLADQIAQPAGNDTDDSVGLTVPWDRTVLTCVLKPGGELKISGINQYGVWARNTSGRVLDAGQMIFWRAEATISSGTPFGGTEKNVSLHETYALQTELPVDEEVLIGSRVTTGKISKCEMWAQ